MRRLIVESRTSLTRLGLVPQEPVTVNSLHPGAINSGITRTFCRKS